jgi:hypothetical protein
MARRRCGATEARLTAPGTELILTQRRKEKKIEMIVVRMIGSA